MDYLLPNNNEQELLSRAKELKLEITFLYPPAEFHQKKFSPRGLFVCASAIKDLNQLQRFKNEKIFISTQNEIVLKAVLQREDIFAITRICSSSGREHMHYRRGGIDQVLAKLATENNITYYVDFSEILNSLGRQRELLLGRIKQNIFIFEKYGAKVGIASFASRPEELRSEKDLESFLKILKKKK